MKNPSSKKLFFVCPNCQMEHFIKKQFGEVFFVTALASVFDLGDIEFRNEISSFIRDRNITDLYVVCDLNCNFLNESVNGDAVQGLKCEELIDSLRSSYDNTYTLAEKLVRHQADSLKRNLNLSVRSGQAIKIHALITSKSNKLINFVYTGSQSELFRINRN